MTFFEHLISLYAPHHCLGCNVEQDALLCPNCSASLPTVPPRCYRCKAVSRCYETCKHCRANSPLSRVYVAQYYEGLTRELLRVVKYGRARAGAAEMAANMAPMLQNVPDDAVLVAVPTATRRVRQRGYDQAELLARYLSRQTSLGLGRFMVRTSQAHQVGASRAERLRHLEDAFRLVRQERIKGAHIVLVDDVLTTGATLEAAARLLKAAGARQVDAVVFAQAS